MNFNLLKSKQMAAEDKSVFLKTYKLFSYLLSILESHEFDSNVSKMVRQTEKLTIFYQVVRNGLNQNNKVKVNSFGYRRLNRMDWLILSVSMFNMVRFIVLIFNSNDEVSFYLGDPLFRSKDRQTLITWSAMVFIIMISFREWSLALEAKGKFKELSIWSTCRYSFNKFDLRMDDHNVKRFRLTIYLVSASAYYVMMVVPLFMSFIFFTLLLTNSWIYKIPKLAFLGLVWSTSTIFAISFLFNSVIGLSWYIICALSFHLFRLLHLLSVADYLVHHSKYWTFVDKDIRTFSLMVIRQLNGYEMAARELRYVFLCFFFVFASAGDVYIFLGLIVRVYSDIFANLLAFLGFFILPAIGLFGLVFGNFISKLNNLTFRLHQLSCKNRLSALTASKVLEIMDRAAGPYNGLKIGDFITLEKSFFILFILENLSTLMLFTVNIGPLIQ